MGILYFPVSLLKDVWNYVLDEIQPL